MEGRDDDWMLEGRVGGLKVLNIRRKGREGI